MATSSKLNPFTHSSVLFILGMTGMEEGRGKKERRHDKKKNLDISMETT